MIVFKSYWKIIKKHIGLIIMFLSISIGMSVLNTSYTTDGNFISVSPTIAIINYDSSKIAHSFIEYMGNTCKIAQVEDTSNAIQDALYYNKVDAILIIPEDFGKDLINGNTPKIDIKESIQNYSVYTEILANRYVRSANIYAKCGMDENEIIASITKDAKNEVIVEVKDSSKTQIQKLAIFYSFENYAFLSVFIFIIGTIMCIFNDQRIKNRNNISSMKSSKFTSGIFLGNMSLTLIIWAIFTIISIILYKDLMFNINGVLLAINSLIFAITIISLSYLIASVIKKQQVVSGIQNVVSLGLSFISGCFISTELLGKNIVNIAKAFPSYWFIDANNKIVELSGFGINELKPVIQNIGIVLGFGILYFVMFWCIKVFKEIKK